MFNRMGALPQRNAPLPQKPSFTPKDPQLCGPLPTMEGLQGSLCTLARKLIRPFINRFGGIPAICGKYTGMENPIGSSTCFNSPMCSEQLIFAMVLGNHPLVRELLEKEVDKDSFDPEPLREAQILGGMRILDLGCGNEPTFARAARCFGADAYTVDIIPATRFHFDKGLFPKESQELESSRHLQLDLREPGAAEKIAAFSGGNFCLVSEGHLDTGWNWEHFGRTEFYHGEELAMKLLGKGGFHFKAGGCLSTIKRCEKPLLL